MQRAKVAELVVAEVQLPEAHGAQLEALHEIRDGLRAEAYSQTPR